MKKLFILLLLPAVFFALSSFTTEEESPKATVITISRNGGGPEGYNKIKELHNGHQHSLRASEPGFDKATWSIYPKLRYCGKTVPEIESDVLKMMENTGLQSGDIAYTRTHVEWKGSKDSYTIIIREE